MSSPLSTTRPDGISRPQTGKQRGERVLVAEVNAGAQGSERDGPVHGSRVEKVEPEPLCQ